MIKTEENSDAKIYENLIIHIQELIIAGQFSGNTEKLILIYFFYFDFHEQRNNEFFFFQKKKKNKKDIFKFWKK